jgi:cell wall-associated NlpC family hydrolase
VTVTAIPSVASVQQRIAQLDALLTGRTAGGASSTAAASSASSTASATGFATQLAAAGLDVSSLGATGLDVSGLAGVTGAAATGGAGASRATGATGPTAQDLVATAEKYTGVPYVWGGESLSEGGLDCSGLVLRSLTDLGVTGIPRTAHEQMTLGTAVPSLDAALPGDLLVFNGGTHIAIYVGDGRMIDAPHPGGEVSVRDVYATPTTIRRILPQEGSAASSSPAVTTSNVDAVRRAALGLLQPVGVAS